MTLIETIVAVAVLATGVVGIASGIATVEHIAQVNQDQAQLQVVMRQLSDWTRSSSSTTCTSAPGGCPNLPYASCASSYPSANITNAESAGALTPGVGITLSIQSVVLSTSGTRTAAGSLSPIWIAPPAGSTCSGSCTAASHSSCVGDWGVQEIVVKVADSSRSLTRTVWKSSSW